MPRSATSRSGALRSLAEQSRVELSGRAKSSYGTSHETDAPVGHGGPMSEPEITRREALQLSVDLSDQAEREQRTPYALYVVFELRSQAAAEAFDKLVADTLIGIEEESGTLVYTVHTPEGEPLTRVFYELYADRAAYREHEQQPHTRHMLQDREQYLAVAPKVVFLNQHLGKLPHGPI